MNNDDELISINMNSTSYTIDTSYTINVNANDLIDYSNISITTGSSDSWWSPISSETTHLEIAQIEKMCEEYPALAKVYENFKTVYDLVKQDWESKNDDTKTS
jgi:uncharacterized pyridoxamine 5'-phosphate oxidase family protein